MAKMKKTLLTPDNPADLEMVVSCSLTEIKRLKENPPYHMDAIRNLAHATKTALEMWLGEIPVDEVELPN
jgi:hypothetical protein